jgi:hypothetical protein
MVRVVDNVAEMCKHFLGEEKTCAELRHGFNCGVGD